MAGLCSNKTIAMACLEDKLNGTMISIAITVDVSTFLTRLF